MLEERVSEPTLKPQALWFDWVKNYIFDLQLCVKTQIRSFKVTYCVARNVTCLICTFFIEVEAHYRAN